MKSDEGIPRRRNERGEAREQFEQRHHAMFGSRAGVLHPIRDASVGETTEPVQSERRARPVTEQALAAEVVSSRDVDPGVEIPSFVLGEEGEELGLLGDGSGRHAIGRGFERELGKGAVLHGGACARLERAVFFVVRWGVDVLRCVPMLAEPGERTRLDATDDRVEVLAAWRRERVEAYAMALVAGEDAVEKDGVEVNIEVQTAAEALDQRDGSGRAAFDAVELLGARPVRSERDFDEDAAERGENVRLERGEPAELMRERQDELADRDVGEDSIDEVGTGVGHSPTRAARADAAGLAAEGDEEIVAARIAVASKKAVGEDSAAEVGAEFSFDIARDRARVRVSGVGEERFQVVADHAIEDALGGAARQVWGGEACHTSAAMRFGVPAVSLSGFNDLRCSKAVLGQMGGGLGQHPGRGCERLETWDPPPRGGDDSGSGTFDFLGFTHGWARSRAGRPVVKRRTAKDRFSRALRRVKEWCRFHRHDPLQVQQQGLARKLRGHFAYFGITANNDAIGRFSYHLGATRPRLALTARGSGDSQEDGKAGDWGPYCGRTSAVASLTRRIPPVTTPRS